MSNIREFRLKVACQLGFLGWSISLRASLSFPPLVHVALCHPPLIRRQSLVTLLACLSRVWTNEHPSVVSYGSSFPFSPSPVWLALLLFVRFPSVIFLGSAPVSSHPFLRVRIVVVSCRVASPRWQPCSVVVVPWAVWSFLP